MTQDRENIVNFHFGIPHHGDAGRDDVQALFYNFGYHQEFGDSIDQQGGLGFLNSNLAGWGGPSGYAEAFGAGAYNGLNGPYSNLCGYNAVLFGPSACATTGGSPLRYADTTIFNPGTTFGQSAAGVGSTTYFAPSQVQHSPGAGISPTNLDTTWNDGSIIKLQYQKNIGSNAYVRLLGYTFYSDWLMSSADFTANS